MLSILSLFLVLHLAQAQDGKKELNNAKKALTSYQADQVTNLGKLGEAVTSLKAAEADPETGSSAETYITKGQVYSAIANQMVTGRELQQDISALPSVELPAVEAAMAFMKAMELAEKKRDRKSAVEGLQTIQTNLSNMGIYAIQDSRYDAAFTNFQANLKAYDALTSTGESSSLETDSVRYNQMYFMGLSAVLDSQYVDARPVLEELVKVDYAEPGIYDAMYKVVSALENPEAGYAYLDQGRQKFPEETQLLFSEINHYLRIGELNKLTSKLEQAIEAEPTNLSLYTTTGSVYDNLYQRTMEEGDSVKAQAFFEKAKDYYGQALEINPKSADAIYSLGALYFNKAATMTQELSELADDLTKEGQRKYDALKVKIDAEFENALPYFKQAEQIDPNDLNTLIALREIFARKNDLETSNEFKTRLEKVQAGQKNDSSYFASEGGK